MQRTKFGHPRRNDILEMTSEELLILAVIQRVEALGAHTLLTDAVVLLSQAKNKISDYVERNHEAANAVVLSTNVARHSPGSLG